MPDIQVDPDSVQSPESDGIQVDPSSVQSPVEVDPDSVQPPQETSSSRFGPIQNKLPQQAIAGLEGASEGLLGPLATAIETKGLGVPEQDIIKRQQDYPTTHGAAKMATMAASIPAGIGEAGLLARGMRRLLPEMSAPLAKLGMSMLSGGIQTGVIQGGDEMSKAMLGQGDPNTPVSSAIANMRGAALLGAGVAGTFSAVGLGLPSALKSIEAQKMGTRADNLLVGLGLAAKARADGIPAEQVEEYLTKQVGDAYYKSYRPGINFYNKVLTEIPKSVATGAGDLAVRALGGHTGAEMVLDPIARKFLSPIVEKVLARPLMGMSKLATPVFMKVLSTGHTKGLLQALDYASKCSKGAEAINQGVEALFKSGVTPAIDYLSDEEKIRDFVDEGGINPQPQDTEQYAEGGHISAHENHIASIYPEQNIMLNTARGRVSNYLTSMKPQDNRPKLAFDKEHKDEASHKKYDSAIKIAANPLSVLKHVKDGSIQIDHLKHMQAMYPEVYQHLKNKVTERITKAQLNKESISSKTRQGMSMFLGVPLESSFTPANIQAAQSVFIPKQPPQQGQPQAAKSKKSTAPLSKVGKSYQTMTQSSEADKNEH